MKKKESFAELTPSSSSQHNSRDRFYVGVIEPYYTTDLRVDRPNTRRIVSFESQNEAYQKLKIDKGYDYCPMHDAWAKLYSVVVVEGEYRQVVPASDPDVHIPSGWALLKNSESEKIRQEQESMKASFAQQ